MRKLIIIVFLVPLFIKAKPFLHDTDKVKQLNKECIPLFSSGDYVKIKALAKEALALAEKSNFAKGKVESIRWYGLAVERTGDPDSAIYFYREGIRIAHENGLKRHEAQCWHNIGFAAYLHSQFDVAVEGYLNAIRIREEIKDTISLGWSENNLGLIYWRQKSRNDALKHFLKANELFGYKNFKEGLALSANNIGLIYEEQGNPKVALNYYKMSYLVNCEIDNKSGIALTLNNIGGIFELQLQRDSAEAYFLKALKINQEINNLEGLELNYRNLGDIYRQKEDYAKALKYIDRSIEVSKEGKSPQGLIASYNSLSRLYEAQGDYKKALEAHRQYAKLNDSLNFGDKLAAMEAKYGKEKSEKEITQLKHKSEITDLELRKKEWMIYFGVAVGLLLLGIIGFSIRTNVQRKKTNAALEQKNSEITSQKEIIEQKSKDITDSILYAKRIQDAVLPPAEDFGKCFSDHFVIFKPRDIVSGDFYWLAHLEEKIIVVLADCTGHGVPGAFMSIIGHDLLNQMVREEKITQPSLILSRMDKSVAEVLNKRSSSQTHDGMDMAIAVFDKKAATVTFSGASRPLMVIEKGNFKLIPGSKHSIGGHRPESEKIFNEEEIKLSDGQIFYLLSDGFADQFGGPRGKKFKFKQIQEKLVAVHDKSLNEQKDIIEMAFNKWKGNLEQVDDVCLIGLSV